MAHYPLYTQWVSADLSLVGVCVKRIGKRLIYLLQAAAEQLAASTLQLGAEHFFENFQSGGRHLSAGWQQLSPSNLA